MLLSYGLQSEAAADKGVAKIFVKSSFKEQFIVWALWALLPKNVPTVKSSSN